MKPGLESRPDVGRRAHLKLDAASAVEAKQASKSTWTVDIERQSRPQQSRHQSPRSPPCRHGAGRSSRRLPDETQPLIPLSSTADRLQCRTCRTFSYRRADDHMWPRHAAQHAGARRSSGWWSSGDDLAYESDLRSWRRREAQGRKPYAFEAGPRRSGCYRRPVRSRLRAEMIAGTARKPVTSTEAVRRYGCRRGEPPGISQRSPRSITLVRVR